MTELVFLEPWICKGSERIGAVGIDLGPCQPVARIANVVLQDGTGKAWVNTGGGCVCHTEREREREREREYK